MVTFPPEIINLILAYCDVRLAIALKNECVKRLLLAKLSLPVVGNLARLSK